MKTFIDIFRWLLTVLFSALLLIITFLSLNVLVLSSKITDADDVKSWISSSGLYENLVPIGLLVLEDRLREGTLEDEIFMTEEEIEELAGSVLEPEWVQEQVEIVIDALYSWLNGDTESIQFTIDLADRKAEIINVINTMLKRKFEAASLCTQSEMLELGDNEFDPFSYSCLPPGMTVEEAHSKVDEFTQAMSEHEAFLADTKLDSSMVMLPPDVEENAPLVFMALKYGPYALLLLGSLISLLIVATSPNHRFGFNLAAVVWALSGFLLVIISIIITSSYEEFIEIYLSEIVPQDQIFIVKEIASPLFIAVVLDIARSYLYIGLATVMASLLSVVGIYSVEFLIDYRRGIKERKSSPFPK
ncbi:MAG: hypothetical protein QY318_02970 [Candidatus Dojkabacteria bacterium]|nr:MAG: hypothetical protein QY318_02970 [Candidatus Dojkabacteria bacterium]